MSHLAPGRKHDIANLLKQRAEAHIYSDRWDTIQLKIDDLIEEGKCQKMHSLRGRLLNAAIASDHDEQIKISYQIDEHIKQHHPKRFKRAWNKRVQKG